MVVVVLLADFDAGWRVATVRGIKTAFASELEQGQLVVIHVPEDWYPPLTGAAFMFNSPMNSHPCHDCFVEAVLKSL